MSQLAEVFAKIDQAGGSIVVRDQEVRVRVRPETLTDQDRAILAQHREDLRYILTPAHITDQEPEVVEDYHLVPLARCETCGSFEQWQDIRGGWHCVGCEPPVKAERLRIEAARLRERNVTRRQAK